MGVRQSLKSPLGKYPEVLMQILCKNILRILFKVEIHSETVPRNRRLPVSHPGIERKQTSALLTDVDKQGSLQ